MPRRKPSIILCSFCGSLEQLQPRHRTTLDGLRALAENPRVSTFERGPAWLESLIRELVAQRLVIEDHTEPYPWHRFNLTDAGRAMLKASPAP